MINNFEKYNPLIAKLIGDPIIEEKINWGSNIIINKKPQYNYHSSYDELMRVFNYINSNKQLDTSITITKNKISLYFNYIIIDAMISLNHHDPENGWFKQGYEFDALYYVIAKFVEKIF